MYINKFVYALDGRVITKFVFFRYIFTSGDFFHNCPYAGEMLVIEGV